MQTSNLVVLMLLRVYLSELSFLIGCRPLSVSFHVSPGYGSGVAQLFRNRNEISSELSKKDF